jgi:tetratricopeptide (TPR) repeat protein
MFDDFDDNDLPGGDDGNQRDIEESLIKFRLLSNDQSVFFSEDEIEILSYHFFLTNKPKNQLKIIDHGLYLFPNKVDFMIEKASIFSISNKHEKALEVIRHAKSLEPYNCLVHKMEAEILADLEQFELSEESFILALEYSQYEDQEFVVDIYINYAQILTQEDNIDKANKLVEKGLKRYPEDELLYNQLSLNFISGGQYEKAVDYFKKHIDKDPYSYLSWFHLGRFYELTNKPSLALSAYEYSGLSNKNSKNAFFSMGSLYESRNEYEKAIESYKQSFKNEKDLYPYICMARCYLAMEKVSEARHALRMAEGLEHMLPEYYYLQGFAYLTGKQPLIALNYFKKVYKEDPEDFAALKGILTCYSELDRSEDIRRYYNDLKKDNDDIISANWKDFASIFYHSELDDLLDEVLDQVKKDKELAEELNGVLHVIKYDQEPSDKNREKIISDLIHNFDDSVESVKLFCPELYYDDEEFKKIIKIYQTDKDEQ